MSNRYTHTQGERNILLYNVDIFDQIDFDSLAKVIREEIAQQTGCDPKEVYIYVRETMQNY